MYEFAKEKKVDIKSIGRKSLSYRSLVELLQ